MKFSIRELWLMVEGYIELHRESMISVTDCIMQACANQMAMTKAVHTGKRVDPKEFWKPRRRATAVTQPIVNHEAFAMMKQGIVPKNRVFKRGAKKQDG